MTDTAPNTSMIGARTDWAPYICSAVDAVIKNVRIEDTISGSVHGNDAGGSFADGWVKTLDLNRAIAPKGGEDIMNDTIADLKNGRCHIFVGDYVGADPDNESDTYDLSTEYHECKNSSTPTFHYILKDIVTIEE